jgi:hypothetical protein
MVRHWNEMLDGAGITEAVFMGFGPGCDYMKDVCAASAGRLHAFTSAVPTLPESAAKIKADLEAGFIGIKLYPVVRQFHVNDPRARAVYDVAREEGVPVLIHFGFSTDPTADLAFGNPLDLNPIARDYPEVPFIIAHFGAGYFREVLALGYQLSNVFVDTSGTNNWRKYMTHTLSLEQVFGKTFETLGVERVLYGTDSGGGTSGYRAHVLEEQLAVLDTLRVTAEERDAVMGGNAQRVMRLRSS